MPGLRIRVRPFSAVRPLITSEWRAAPGTGVCCVHTLDRFSAEAGRLNATRPIRLRVLPRYVPVTPCTLPFQVVARSTALHSLLVCTPSTRGRMPPQTTCYRRFAWRHRTFPSGSITRHRQSMRGCAPLALRLKALGFSCMRPLLLHSHHDNLFASACARVHGPSGGCACHRLHREGTGSR